MAFDIADFPFLLAMLLAFFWLGALTFLLLRIMRTFKRLTGGEDRDLKSSLDEVLSSVRESRLATEALEKEINALKVKGLESIQKVGLVRYNPFSDTGGNQSFVLALLDGNDSGFVITSLHSRESTRVFAKPVTGGKEEGFEFSKEEVQAVKEAQKSNKESKK